MNAYLPADLVREANYATGNHLNVAVHLAHLYGINCRQLGPDRVAILADGLDLMRLPLSGWYARPMTAEPLTVGRADYRDILVGDSE